MSMRHEIQILLSMLLDPARAHTTAAELELWTGGLLGREVYRNSQQKWCAKEGCLKECGLSELHFYEWLFLLSPDCVKHSTYITETTVQWTWKHTTREKRYHKTEELRVLKTPNGCRWNAKILVWLRHGYQQPFRFLSEGWCDHMKTHFEKMTGDIK